MSKSRKSGIIIISMRINKRSQRRVLVERDSSNGSEELKGRRCWGGIGIMMEQMMEAIVVEWRRRRRGCLGSEKMMIMIMMMISRSMMMKRGEREVKWGGGRRVGFGVQGCLPETQMVKLVLTSSIIIRGMVIIISAAAPIGRRGSDGFGVWRADLQRQIWLCWE